MKHIFTFAFFLPFSLSLSYSSLHPANINSVCIYTYIHYETWLPTVTYLATTTASPSCPFPLSFPSVPLSFFPPLLSLSPPSANPATTSTDRVVWWFGYIGDSFGLVILAGCLDGIAFPGFYTYLP